MNTINPHSPLPLTRRGFLANAALALGAAGIASTPRSARAQNAPSRTLNVGVMGLGRGLALAQAAIDLPGVRLAYLCDVDSRRLEAAAKAVTSKVNPPPKTVTDCRRMFDDREVDAVLIATCNHWHAPATILACQAGKHVYVEKPGSHNPREGEWMVAAARRHQRLVQQGTQRRSWPGIVEGIDRLRAGAIGRVLYARCWYTNARPSIGRGKTTPPPPHLDYALWQGPAPDRPYQDNLVHYNWHWHWHWGNGELGNNGIHYLDLARWGLGVDYPRRVAYSGGRYHFQDDQETPDTGVVTFDFGRQGISWEHSSCHPRRPESFPLVTFYGDGGTLALDSAGFKIWDPAGQLTEQKNGPGDDKLHLEVFFRAIREQGRLTAEIAEGQRSTLLCHLGNIAYRTASVLDVDPANGRIRNNRRTSGLWERQYRPGWKPQA